MKRILILSVATTCCMAFSPARNPGDHSTAGYGPRRTYLNSEAGNLRPPLERVETIPLTGVSAARSLVVFEDYFLVGEGGASVTWRLFDRTTGEARWSRSFEGGAAGLSYVPAVGGDAALLGGVAGGGVAAVRVSTGEDLWADDAVGTANGRHPILTGGIAVYAGERGVAVADAVTGEVIRRESIGTSEAPLALIGGRVYLLTAEGALQARDLFDGAVLWSAEGVGADGSNIIAGESLVFVNNPETGDVAALRAADGGAAWTRNVSRDLAGLAVLGWPHRHGRPAIALAYDLLFVFAAGLMRAHDPASGDVVWEREKASVPSPIHGLPPGVGAPLHAVVANNRIFYWSTASNLRVREAFSGTVLWSALAGWSDVSAVRELSMAASGVFALFDSEVQVWSPSHEIYFPHLADGGPSGERATTLMIPTNPSPEAAGGTIRFPVDNGDPLVVEVRDREPDSAFDFTIEPHGSLAIQTLGNREAPVGGWARVVADRPIGGTAVFQTGDGATTIYEAGVSDSPATGFAGLFVHRFELSGARFGTGVAVANPGDVGTFIEFELRTTAPEGPILTRTVRLGSNVKTALFLEELFEEVAGTDTEGTLLVSSQIPVAIVALRTRNGFQMSSYPVVQPVR